MKFSVVIPAFNGERYIDKAIDSVLNQTRKTDELIVYDDNSQDSTSKICKSYGHHLKYCFNKDGPSGFVNGWNKAIAIARWEYIVLLHQDDVLYPTFIEEAEMALKKYPDARHLFSLCDYISDIGILLGSGEKAIKKNYTIGNTILFSGLDYVKAYQKCYAEMPHIHRCPGVVTHKSIFETGTVYNPYAGHIADDDFFYRVGQETEVIGIIKSLAAFRVHDESVSGRLDNISITKKLAEDYIFQVKQWQNSDFLGVSEKKYFEYWAFKYLFRLFFFAFKSNSSDLYQYGLQLKKELFALVLHHYFMLEKIKIGIFKIICQKKL